MHNIPIAQVEDLDRAVVAIGTDYPHDHLLAWHEHRRAQVLYAATGLMHVETADGSWTVPTARAVLIPPAVRHQVAMKGVSTRSLYLEPAAVPWFPARCQVVDVSTLLRSLILAAVEMEPRYPERGRDAAVADLLLHELRSLTPLPLDVPLPQQPRLRELCEAFLRQPDVHDPPSRWCAALNISERTLGRLLRRETGLSFAQWRQRACILHSLPLLDAGVPVTRIASGLGYDNPAAYTAAFGRLLGRPPTAYRRPAGQRVNRTAGQPVGEPAGVKVSDAVSSISPTRAGSVVGPEAHRV
ncbi:AraC family transcriptional regulator [Streptacidiphilus jiangxiensis]|uniref:AraC-type DNA-binding protein n=1 Tax=Streptacidiphilus jiangxiensis TaxID=235985 RepID=A0A1H7HXJ3_STRJI|nr:helix-turn-helix transcriptional regulator [Streptacidiphilus jiangxiensis]SEK54868.1 AraC-type DNA-binding protein [Streptacidiphilus jiangxiensis]